MPIREHGAIRPALMSVMVGAAALQVAVHPSAATVTPQALADRQDYNAASARIDSLTRAMRRLDPRAVEAQRLPQTDRAEVIPEGMQAVLLFWADDEARVWLNGYLVGQTRLTPVEVEVPSVYFGRENELRVRAWDTDYVESGFLLGLYLQDANGARRAVLVTDESWSMGRGPASQITYVHPLPDIPGASVIWGDTVLGYVELHRRFHAGDLRDATGRSPVRTPHDPRPADAMDYHRFLQELAQLEAARSEIRQRLGAGQVNVIQPPTRSGGHAPGLTLGKAGPLQEAVTAPVAAAVLAWARQLGAADRRLVLPQARSLKGEGAATQAAGVAGGSAAEDRRRNYVPPVDRQASPGGRRGKGAGEAGDGANGGEGAEGGAGRGVGGTGGGRAPRLGLLVPTAVLGVYLAFLARQLQVES